MDYSHPSRDHGRDRPADAELRRASPTTSWRSSARCSGPATRSSAGRHAADARGSLRARQGQVHADRVRPHRRADRATLPADPDDRPHPLAIQCRRADEAHGQPAWHDEDVLEIHPFDAENRGHQMAIWAAGEPFGRHRAAGAKSPSGCSRAWSTPPSTTPRPAPTSSPPIIRTGRPTAREYKVTAVQVATTARLCARFGSRKRGMERRISPAA
jgi:hypothetical protein